MAKYRNMKEKEMYIVKYYGGSYDDFYEHIVFVTDNKKTATNYVRKFNSILKKWKDHYKQYTEKKFMIPWLKDEHIDKYNRWSSLRNVTKCYYEKVEQR